MWSADQRSGWSGDWRAIDFLVFSEVPLEVALARLVKRQLAESKLLAEYTEAYEAVVRDVYGEQTRQVAPEADLMIDGRAPLRPTSV